MALVFVTKLTGIWVRTLHNAVHPYLSLQVNVGTSMTINMLVIRKQTIRPSQKKDHPLSL